MRCFLRVLAAAAMLALPALAGPQVYLEDSHAGSFYWIASHLPLGEPAALVMIDDHSDATARPDSDSLRDTLNYSNDRPALLEGWRKKGEISCDAWIEPLMPSPLAEVLWVSALQQDDATTARKQADVHRLLTAHAEVSPRDVEQIASRYQVTDLAHAASLTTTWPKKRPVVVSIDLDFFARMEAADTERAFEEVWKLVLGFDERLAVITFAVSRPWLKSDAQAHALVEIALRHALSLKTAQINLEPFASTGPDSSLMFQGYYKRGETPPAWQLANATEPLRALLLSARNRLTIKNDVRRWNEILDGWEEELATPHLCVQGHAPGADELWRVPAGGAFAVGLDNSTRVPDDAEVRWLVKRPVADSFNLGKGTGLGGLFAANASSLPRDEEVEVARTRGKEALSSTMLDPFFDPKTGWGVVQVQAEMGSEGHWRRSPPTAIARCGPGKGARGAITEGFNLPYVFGATFLHDEESTGPETLCGADCATFVMAALRKTGHAIRWGAPADLRRALQPLAAGTRLTETLLDEGVIVDFDTHMTLLMEDRGKRGEVDKEDIVAHHLEGMPALISLGELMRQRGYKSYRVLRIPPPDAQSVKLLFGGDVMLGRGIGPHPLNALANTFKAADLALANLECVLSGQGTPTPGKAYVFRAPAADAEMLCEAGISAVSLANNHAMDYGPEALEEMRDTLARARVRDTGAGPAPVAARMVKVKGLNVALVGLSDVSEPRELATPDHAGVASAADLDVVREARRQADAVIVFMHWGTEGQKETTARQRSLARQLMLAGADAVVGAHPHCVQPLEICAGRPVAFSLGNLVFDGGLPGSDWNQGALLELTLSASTGRPQAWRLIPVEIDAAGEPHLASEGSTKETRDIKVGHASGGDAPNAREPDSAPGKR